MPVRQDRQPPRHFPRRLVHAGQIDLAQKAHLGRLIRVVLRTVDAQLVQARLRTSHGRPQDAAIPVCHQDVVGAGQTKGDGGIALAFFTVFEFFQELEIAGDNDDFA